MPRTFSLARLMVGVTLLCVVFGVAVNWPDWFVILLILSPNVVPALILSYYSRHRGLLLFFASLGLLYGIATWSMLEAFSPGLNGVVFIFSPGIGATIAAGSYLHVERCLLGLKNKQPQLHTERLQSFK